MENRRLGSSGLALSELTLGTLTWGRDTDEHEASDLLSIYLDGGGRTLDVPSDYMAPAFSGRSALVGSTVRNQIPREEVVFIGHSGVLPKSRAWGDAAVPVQMGAEVSRRNLLCSLDHLLHELETDFIDVWVIHGPGRGVLHKEIMGAASTAVSAGKVAYVGLAGFDPWDMGALSTVASESENPIAALAGPLSLLESGALHDLIPHAVDQGSGYIALTPLTMGVLTGKYRHSTPPDSRAATAHLGPAVKPHLTPENNRVVEALMRASAGLDTSPARLAVAWVLTQPGVATAVTGPRTARQLETLLEGGSLRLQRELREVLTEIAIP